MGFGSSFGPRRDIYDGATGIYARWYFEQRLNEECTRARRQGRRFALFCLAVDDRSALTAGHELRKHVRDYDLVGRVARSRFAVTLLDAFPVSADEIADRLRSVVDVSCDVAFAWYPEDGANARQLLACATQQLLESKAG